MSRNRVSIDLCVIFVARSIGFDHSIDARAKGMRARRIYQTNSLRLESRLSNKSISIKLSPALKPYCGSKKS